jgi:DNA replication protein DnaC
MDDDGLEAEIDIGLDDAYRNDVVDLFDEAFSNMIVNAIEQEKLLMDEDEDEDDKDGHMFEVRGRLQIGYRIGYAGNPLIYYEHIYLNAGEIPVLINLNDMNEEERYIEDAIDSVRAKVEFLLDNIAEQYPDRLIYYEVGYLFIRLIDMDEGGCTDKRSYSPRLILNGKTMSLTTFKSNNNNCAITNLLVIHERGYDRVMTSFKRKPDKIRYELKLPIGTMLTPPQVKQVADYLKINLRLLDGASGDTLLDFVDDDKKENKDITSTMVLFDKHYWIENFRVKKKKQKRCKCGIFYYDEHDCLLEQKHARKVQRDSVNMSRITKSLMMRSEDGTQRNTTLMETNDAFKRAFQNNEAAAIYLCGPGGTGKTFIIEKVYQMLMNNNKSTLLCTPTGAACERFMNTPASTIHRAFKIPIRKGMININDIFKTLTTKYPDQLKKLVELQVLIIDEVSMVDAYLFNIVDSLLSRIKNNPEPFGGISVMISGDVLQLPSVDGFPFYRSYAFRRFTELNYKIVLCIKNYRFKEQAWYYDLLRIRNNELPDYILQKLMKRNITETERISSYPFATVFTSTCARRDHFNHTALQRLPGYCITIKAKDKGKVKEADSRLDEHIRVKPNCMIMITHNIEESVMNGSIATFVHYDAKKDECVLILENGVEYALKRHRYVDPCHPNVTRLQFPFVLAYSMTIHKAQGCSIKHDMIIDFGETKRQEFFACGQLYVALSRACSFDKLHILNATRNKILNALKTDSHDKKFDAWLLQQCDIDMNSTSIAKHFYADETRDHDLIISSDQEETLSNSHDSSHDSQDTQYITAYKKLRFTRPFMRSIMFDLETAPEHESCMDEGERVDFRRQVAYTNNINIYRNAHRASKKVMFLRKPSNLDINLDYKQMSEWCTSTKALKIAKRIKIVDDVVQATCDLIENLILQDCKEYDSIACKQSKSKDDFKSLAMLRRPWRLCAFNGGNFDFHFLMRNFTRESFKERFDISYIPKGGKIVYMHIRDIRSKRIVLRTHDMCNIFTNSLSNLCMDFCSLSIKGEFPHDLIARKGWQHCLQKTIPFDPQDFPVKMRKSASKLADAKNQFHIFENLLLYAQNDVDCMFELYMRVDDLFQGSDDERTKHTERTIALYGKKGVGGINSSSDVIGLVGTSVMNFLTIRQVAMYELLTVSLPAKLRFPSTMRGEVRTRIAMTPRWQDRLIRESVFGGHCGPNIKGFISKNLIQKYPLLHQTLCNEHKSKPLIDQLTRDIEEGKLKWEDFNDWMLVADFCSMYPAAMTLTPFPFEKHIFVTPETNPFAINAFDKWLRYWGSSWFRRIRLRSVFRELMSDAPLHAKHVIINFDGVGNLDQSMIGTGMRDEKTNRLVWEHKECTRTYNEVDLQLFLGDGGFIGKINWIMYWTHSDKWIRPTIERLRKIKNEGDENNQPAKRNGGKTCLNTVYGMSLMQEHNTSHAMTQNVEVVEEFYKLHQDVSETNLLKNSKAEHDSLYILHGIKTSSFDEKEFIKTSPQLGSLVLATSHWMYEQALDCACPERRQNTFKNLAHQNLYSDTDSFFLHCSHVERLVREGFFNDNSTFGRLTDDNGIRKSKGAPFDWMECDPQNDQVRFRFTKLIMSFMIAPKCYTYIYITPTNKLKVKVRVAGIAHQGIVVDNMFDELPAHVLIDAYLQSRNETDEMKPEERKGKVEVDMPKRFKKQCLRKTPERHWNIEMESIKRTIFKKLWRTRPVIPFQDPEGRFFDITCPANWKMRDLIMSHPERFCNAEDLMQPTHVPELYSLSECIKSFI